MSLPPSKLTGCDFSGTFAKANDSSPSGHGFCEGDRVAGIIRGCKDSHAGKFAEYLVADPHMCFLVPREMRLEEACTLGVGWVSATQALQQRLFEDVGEGGEKRGLVRSMRFYPHHSRLQNLGADACFDYKSSTIEKDVKALQKDVTRAIDCFSEGPSTVLCANLMGKAGAKDHTGRIVRTLPPGMIKGTVPSGIRANEWIVSYTALGKPFWFLFKYYPASPTDHAIATKNLKQLAALLKTETVKPVRHRLVEGGLETGLAKGFEEMKAGQVKGEKLVVRVGAEV